jgi:hypothetical protein
MALRALKVPQEPARVRQVLGCLQPPSARAEKLRRRQAALDDAHRSRAPADRFRRTPKGVNTVKTLDSSKKITHNAHYRVLPNN